MFLIVLATYISDPTVIKFCSYKSGFVEEIHVD